MNAKVIDLSHHNVIPSSLQPTKDAGVLGVIHKLTEGLIHVDEKAQARHALASEAGLLWGLYHFLRPKNVEAQAKFFVGRARDLGVMDSKTLMVCDFEVDNITLPEVLSFMQYVERETGRIPMLYSGHTLKDLGGCRACPPLARYRLWLAQYGSKAVLPKGYDHYWLWQFTEDGTIPGVRGKADLNHFDGSDEELIEGWAGDVT